MRYLMMVMGNADYEAGRPAPAKLYELMGAFIEKQMKTGGIVNTAGLKPTRYGYKVEARDGVVTVKDGPFTEAREIIGGYAIVDAPTDEAILGVAREFVDVHIRAGVRDVDCQIRPLQGGPDAA